MKRVAFKIEVNNNDLHAVRPNCGVIETGSNVKVNLLYVPVATSLNVEDSNFKVFVSFTELAANADPSEVLNFLSGVQEADQHEF